ncbi:hypothetical protein BFP70_13090 [Thioclava sp. SK-1]|uniref:hypothetical protein n=1 Tax=Thioclava sp. SK-1 TaxID=1889770 RepID=UPI0008263BEA|nr:hypothetical protein [Thioclava sp. SK-1]OCX63138.1 hypothetical protein BFP70_13090 [Thioclava sp. SK-1]
MKWQHIEQNWSAFYEAILERWDGTDADGLDDVDGDQKAFIAYIAKVTEIEPIDARDEIRDWMAGELPSDVVMDPSHDDHSLQNSAKYVNEGEDEYDDDAAFGDDNAAENPVGREAS